MRRVISLLIAFATIASAQSTGVISGSVEDTTGAVIPGAAVSAIQAQTRSLPRGGD